MFGCDVMSDPNVLAREYSASPALLVSTERQTRQRDPLSLLIHYEPPGSNSPARIAHLSLRNLGNNPDLFPGTWCVSAAAPVRATLTRGSAVRTTRVAAVISSGRFCGGSAPRHGC